MTNISSVKYSAKTSIELSPESLLKPSVQASIKPSAKPSAVIFATNAVIINKIRLRPKFLLGTRCQDAATFSTSVYTECGFMSIDGFGNYNK
jgi:hypothetical protein